MPQVHMTAAKLSILSFILNIQLTCLSPPAAHQRCGQASVIQVRGRDAGHKSDSESTSPETTWCLSFPSSQSTSPETTWCLSFSSSSAASTLKQKLGVKFSSSGVPPSSSSGPQSRSLYASFNHISNILHSRVQRSTLTRHNTGPTLPQVQNAPPSSAYRVTFNKCVQVKRHTDPPQLTFFLRIHNMGPVGGTNLSHVAIRDSLSGIIPLRTEGRVVERGYQTFAIDSLSAGSQVVVNYTAHIRSPKNEVLDLPAFLTFSNASQNDVSMFGPLTANLTLRVNSTDRIHPNHGVHFAGFVAGFFMIMVLLLLGFLAVNQIGLRTRLHLLQQRKRGDPDPEDADCNTSGTIKDEATFEDKLVDIMVLEDPQNMNQALENLEMSTLLRATNNLEANRIQIYKDVVSSLLGSLRSQGQATAQAQQRLLSVLHGQLQGMEGRLKEERGSRMAALAGQCNLETREEMEAEHCREAAEKAQAELLCRHADQQDLLQCSALLEKLHKVSQSQLQRILLVRHEEASARVQRQIIEWRRVELHKIFAEELEEATRMGELEKNTVKSLQHEYFTCQDQLEEVLDVVLANQRYVLAERHAQRKFLVHSLHSLNSLISDTFSCASSNLDSWFAHLRRGSTVPVEQADHLQEKAQKELLVLRQRLDEALNQERRAMRCGLIKKRRELISEMLRVHKQREKDLSGLSRGVDRRMDVAQNLHCWQKILTTHNLELAELINNLDEEAAADIRKMTMRAIQGAVAEVKAILPSTAQTLLSSLPPGTNHSLLQVEPEQGAGQAQGQGAGTLLQGQERLHQEGKAALRTLSSTREALQAAMERELQEQKEIRAHCRAFFRCLCSTQLTLSEDDRLKIKLEFQKCLSVMDRCLVLPHAISRTKLHTSLAAWKKDCEKQMINTQSKGKTGKARQHTQTHDLLFFQKRLEDRIQLFENSKQRESSVRNKVLEEMQREREDELRSQADSLAIQMAAIHHQKAERRTKVLETSRAMLSLHSLLIQLLRMRKSLEKQDMALSIQNHCLGLEEAEQQLLKDRTELSSLLQQDCRMTSILQEALYKSDQVTAILTESLEERTANNQAIEDLKEQMELKRLYANCDQDLEFASQLVKQGQLSAEVLLEILRLLLPTLPESELLSITDALYPKQHPVTSSKEPEPHLETAIPLTTASLSSRSHRLQEKRQSLMEKLLPRLRLLFPNDAEEAEKEKEDFTKGQQPIYKSALGENAVGQPHSALGRSSTGERLFVFRDAPGSTNDYVDVPRKKTKRSFLNRKKTSVAPTNIS
uniref:EvC ciliary complex subunit 2 n=1 Tax=Cynoglossus semilaevis TaxID=244447 RepID=A0A3P8VF86_CYNSE